MYVDKREEGSYNSSLRRWSCSLESKMIIEREGVNRGNRKEDLEKMINKDKVWKCHHKLNDFI